MDTPTRPEMPYEIALVFVQSTMEPGQASWSGQFLWEQPEPDELVMVGGIYGSPPDSFSVLQIVYGVTNPLQLFDPDYPMDEEKYTKHSTNQMALVKLAHELWGDGKQPYLNDVLADFIHEPDTSDIIASDKFLVPFAALTLFEQIKYRFAMMFVNGPNYGHQWACDYLEELGCTYYDRAQNGVIWQGHDCDTDLSTFLREVARRGYSFPARRDRNYTASEICFEDDTIEEWVVEADRGGKLFPEFMDDREWNELVKLMAYAIDQACEAWEKGDLQFSESAPELILAWMRENGIEPVVIQPTAWDAIRNGTLGEGSKDQP